MYEIVRKVGRLDTQVGVDAVVLRQNFFLLGNICS